MAYRDYELADLHVGDEVRAFHPRSLGVIWPGEVAKVGRKMVHIRFGVDGRTYRLNPKYVSEITKSDHIQRIREHGNDGEGSV